MEYLSVEIDTFLWEYFTHLISKYLSVESIFICNEIVSDQFRYAKRASDPAKTRSLLLIHNLFVTL